MRRPRLLGALAATAMLLGVAALAGAHSLVRPAGETIAYLSADATSMNTLSVRLDGARIEFRDPTVDGGMDPGDCTPGDVTPDANAWIVQTFCPARGVSGLRLDLGDREDTATVAVAMAVTLLGGRGADRLTTGDEPDQLSGDDGDDRLVAGGGADTVLGGPGADAIDAGPGDDRLRVRDGQRDVVLCGDGTDAVDADQLDDVAADCESVTRTPTPPPAGVASGRDTRAPTIAVGARTLQRLGRAGAVRVAATSTEPGTIGASGFLDAAGLSLPLKSSTKRVRVGGGGVELSIRLTRRQLAECRRAFRRGRPVRVRLGVVATDLAGNSRERRAPVIRLRR